jgi:glycosyltransferase involved in cell wall biosynthesis
VIIDAREYIPRRPTGIGRFIAGLVNALVENGAVGRTVLLVYYPEAVPENILQKKDVHIESLPLSFLMSEKKVSSLTKSGSSIFISPYPKLPLIGCHCPAVHTVHDILYLTHPAYRRRLKAPFDRYRLKTALKRADLTWYDSSWSMEETRSHIGMVGKNPRIRHPGLDKRSYRNDPKDSLAALSRLKLQPGYVLVIGNGSPHKNLGVLLRISKRVPRPIVFVGVLKKNRDYWQSRYPDSNAIWFENVEDDDLESMIAEAFCIAQPSTAEGYGYPPLEAMAREVPAIVSDIPVLVESTGGNALFANPFDPQSWLDKIQSLEEDHIRKTLVERGRHWVSPKLGKKGWDLFLSDIEELCHGL